MPDIQAGKSWCTLSFVTRTLQSIGWWGVMDRLKEFTKLPNYAETLCFLSVVCTLSTAASLHGESCLPSEAVIPNGWSRNGLTLALQRATLCASRIETMIGSQSCPWCWQSGKDVAAATRQGKLGEEEINTPRCTTFALYTLAPGRCLTSSKDLGWRPEVQQAVSSSPLCCESACSHQTCSFTAVPIQCLNWIAQMVWISATRSCQLHYQYQEGNCSQLPSTWLSYFLTALKLQGYKF